MFAAAPAGSAPSAGTGSPPAGSPGTVPPHLVRAAQDAPASRPAFTELTRAFAMSGTLTDRPAPVEFFARSRGARRRRRRVRVKLNRPSSREAPMTAGRGYWMPAGSGRWVTGGDYARLRVADVEPGADRGRAAGRLRRGPAHPGRTGRAAGAGLRGADLCRPVRTGRRPAHGPPSVAGAGAARSRVPGRGAAAGGLGGHERPGGRLARLRPDGSVHARDHRDPCGDPRPLRPRPDPQERGAGRRDGDRGPGARLAGHRVLRADRGRGRGHGRHRGSSGDQCPHDQPGPSRRPGGPGGP